MKRLRKLFAHAHQWDDTAVNRFGSPVAQRCRCGATRRAVADDRPLVVMRGVIAFPRFTYRWEQSDGITGPWLHMLTDEPVPETKVTYIP